jgi:hypothetical protein
MQTTFAFHKFSTTTSIFDAQGALERRGGHTLRWLRRCAGVVDPANQSSSASGSHSGGGDSALIGGASGCCGSPFEDATDLLQALAVQQSNNLNCA